MKKAKGINKVVKEMTEAIQSSDKRKTAAYDTTAKVLRIDGETAWVHLAGGIDETPVKLTIRATPGDQVQVRVSNGRAWITGNVTNPPTDDSRANYVYNYLNGRLDVPEAYIHDLIANNITTDNLKATNGFIQYLIAGDITAEDITTDHAEIQALDANYAHITEGVIDNAKIGYADVNDLDAHYAKIDFENVNNSWITNGIIKNAAISDAMISGVSANKLTAGTIDASNITVTNLNASNITAGSITVDGITIDIANNEASIDGAYVEEGTITLSGLAQEVTDKIDGAIESFTGSAVPTLNNYPASGWSADERASHVGDVYYVVNSAITEDGYCYRFTHSNNEYSWTLIKDSDVTAALSRLTTAEGNITNLQTFETNTERWITDTDDELSSLQQRTTTLETDMEDKVDVTTFNTLSQSVDTNTANITSLSTTVQNKADSSTVTALSNTVNTVQQTANGNSSKLSNLITVLGTNPDGTTSATDVVHRTSALEQDLSGFKTTVASTYYTQTDASALSGRVTSAETTITQLSNNILLTATAADSTAAEAGQHLIESFLNFAPSGVTIGFDKLGLIVGSRNYLLGTGESWYIEIPSEDPGGDYLYDISTSIEQENLTNGSYVTLSFDWETRATGGQFAPWLYANSQLYEFGTPEKSIGADGDVIEISQENRSGHVEIVYSLTSTSASVISGAKLWVEFEGLDGDLELNNVMLEKGNQASSWKLAQEDVEDLVQGAYDSADDAAKTATTYITRVDANGIKVHPSSDSSGTSNYIRINADGSDIYKGGNSVAMFGETARVGRDAQGYSRTILSSTGMQIKYRSSTQDEVIAHLGYGQCVGATAGSTLDSPYYTFGTRANSPIGAQSFAHGNGVEATRYFAHAEGEMTTASGESSHAEGRMSTASGSYSHAEGEHCAAGTFGSHAEGYHTSASGQYAHAEGSYTSASGNWSHAQGESTIAAKDYQTVLGRWNVSDSSNMLVIGCGLDEANRRNALTMDTSGNLILKQSVTAEGKLEVGGVLETKYIDLHASSGGASDYDCRLTTSAGSSTGGGFLHINGQPVKDFVTETGTSSSWRYRKWKSGKVEAWRTYNAGSLTPTQWIAGSWYVKDFDVAIPSGIFSAAPNHTVATNNGSDYQYMVHVARATSATNIRVRVCKPNAGAATPVVALYVSNMV